MRCIRPSGKLNFLSLSMTPQYNTLLNAFSKLSRDFRFFEGVLDTSSLCRTSTSNSPRTFRHLYSVRQPPPYYADVLSLCPIMRAEIHRMSCQLREREFALTRTELRNLILSFLCWWTVSLLIASCWTLSNNLHSSHRVPYFWHQWT